MVATMQQVREELDPDEPDYVKASRMGAEALQAMEIPEPISLRLWAWCLESAKTIRDAYVNWYRDGTNELKNELRPVTPEMHKNWLQLMKPVGRRRFIQIRSRVRNYYKKNP